MRRVLRCSIVLALVLSAAACGSDDDEPAATTTTSTAPETIPEDTEPDRTIDRTRLVFAPVTSSGGCPPDVTVPQSAEETPDETDDESTDTTVTDGAQAEDEAEDGASGISGIRAVEPPGGPYPTADGMFCYTVGESVADGNDLTDATLSEAGGAYQVFTRVKPDSIDKVNGLFNACYSGAPTCPAGEGGRGYVAIIWEGVVLYAPAVQTEDIAESGLSLAGGLSERRARDLITLINR